MDVLIETHDEDEIRRALRIDGRMIGVNNRNLHTFETKLETTERLAPMIPTGRIAVAESGIATPAEIARLKKAGVHAFLVGESLMRQADVAAATKALMAS
jgi:indole-3-glycerol phosphate synthase